MLGEAVESCNAWRPWATRPIPTKSGPSAKCARSRRDGAALGVARRCADEESPTGCPSPARLALPPMALPHS